MEPNNRRTNKTRNIIQDSTFQAKFILSKNIKFFLHTIFLFLLLTLICNTAYCITNHEKILITVNKFISHPALDAAEKGIMKTLKDRALIPNKVSIKLDNAQGNITNSIQIAKHHAAMAPRFMVAIATPAAQADFKAKLDTTVLAFAAVTDPTAAGISCSREKVIGVTDQPPILELVEAVNKILPNTKVIGVIFNPGEINSVKMIEQIEKIAANNGIKVKKVTVTSSANVVVATQKLVHEADLIYLPQDNTVISSIDSIIHISARAKIPVIANDPSLVDKGLLFAIGADYFSMGVQLGNMMADLMEGKKLENAIQEPNTKEIKINYKVADDLGIKIPDNIQFNNNAQKAKVTNE